MSIIALDCPACEARLAGFTHTGGISHDTLAIPYVAVGDHRSGLANSIPESERDNYSDNSEINDD